MGEMARHGLVQKTGWPTRLLWRRQNGQHRWRLLYGQRSIGVATAVVPVEGEGLRSIEYEEQTRGKKKKERKYKAARTCSSDGKRGCGMSQELCQVKVVLLRYRHLGLARFAAASP
jgi:hypothetical protein